MKRELGIARCGLACCLCTENETCSGCDSGECPDKDWCENRKCSISKRIEHCYECKDTCTKGLLSKINRMLLQNLPEDMVRITFWTAIERNEKKGVIYHREGINGDYDDFDDVDALIEYIKNRI